MWYLEVRLDGRDKPLKKYKNIREEKFTRLLRKIESLSKKNRNLYCIYWYEENSSGVQTACGTAWMNG